MGEYNQYHRPPKILPKVQSELGQKIIRRGKIYPNAKDFKALPKREQYPTLMQAQQLQPEMLEGVKPQ